MNKIMTTLFGLVLATSVATSAQAGFLDDTKVTGTFDASYTYNINNPADGVIATRFYHNDHNSFEFNRAELEFENSPADWAKFRLDIETGSNTDNASGTNVGVQQAYVDLATASGLSFKIGRFNTIIGAEAIETGYNFNSTRSVLFGANPVHHTGILASYAFSDMASASLGLVNGQLDQISDADEAKTLLYQVAFAPQDNFDFSIQGAVGTEGGEDFDKLRFIVDLVINWQATEQFLLQLNANYINQRKVGKIYDVLGASLIGNYVVSDSFALAARVEFVTLGDTLAGVGIEDDNYLGATITAKFPMADGFEGRLEVRHDQNLDSEVYTNADGDGRKFQDTVSAGIVYNF